MPCFQLRSTRQALAATLAVLVAGALSAATTVEPLATGAAMPDFNLPGVDGKQYTPASFKDAKVLAIAFTSNHCPTAQAYEARLKKLAADFKPKGVAFLAVNANHADAVRLDEMGYTDLGDTFEELKIRAEHQNFNFPYVDDGPEQKMTAAYGPAATPHMFVFDSKRRLRFQGRIDDSERADLVKEQTTRDVIEALLAGREPPVTQTKVFGCSIKWKDKTEDNLRWLEKVAQEPVKLERADAATLKELRANAGTDTLRVINLWATWCGPCVSEFDELIETNLRFRHRDFELVTVAAQFPQEEAKVLRFLKQHHASTRNYIFGDSDKYALLEAIDPEWNGALPHTLVIAPDGKVVHRQTGALDFLELRRAILPAIDAISPWPASGK